MSPLHRKLLLSYLLVLAIGVGGVALVVWLISPNLFDRLMAGHMGAGHGPMHERMSPDVASDTRAVFGTAMLRSLLIASALATLAAVAVSAWVSDRITRPVRRLAAATGRIARGEYDERVPLPAGAPDEIGDLAARFNAMAATLADAERQRVHLIGDVAHEIRTPLTTLRGNLEGMIDGVVAPTPELLARLYDETTRLNRLVDDLQELSRVESGSVSLRIERHGPARLIEQAVATLAAPAAAKGVALGVDELLPLPDVLADADRTGQVLANLLANALRYTPEGGSVRVAARRAGDQVEFAIRDTGIGIAPEHLPHVFERFYRADPARARASGGSGIGLTVARALVEAQGGTIRAESPGPGQGTTVTFTLPVAS